MKSFLELVEAHPCPSPVSSLRYANHGGANDREGRSAGGSVLADDLASGVLPWHFLSSLVRAQCAPPWVKKCEMNRRLPHGRSRLRVEVVVHFPEERFRG